LYRDHVTVEVDGFGLIEGQVAWGGNWFFLCSQTPYELLASNIPKLTICAEATMAALAMAGITGKDGAKIDHIEFFGPPHAKDSNSRNFVLCPGGAYDRSPCGTGTSAKLACLAAAGKLPAGESWIQESIIGSRFEARYRPGAHGIIPSITGRAYVTAEAILLRDPRDFLSSLTTSPVQ
jgi:4-hydroxyproline epimerase